MNVLKHLDDIITAYYTGRLKEAEELRKALTVALANSNKAENRILLMFLHEEHDTVSDKIVCLKRALRYLQEAYNRGKNGTQNYGRY